MAIAKEVLVRSKIKTKPLAEIEGLNMIYSGNKDRVSEVTNPNSVTENLELAHTYLNRLDEKIRVMLNRIEPQPMPDPDEYKTVGILDATRSLIPRLERLENYLEVIFTRL